MGVYNAGKFYVKKWGKLICDSILPAASQGGTQMLNLHEWKHGELAEAAYERGYENSYEMTEHELRDILYDLLDDE